MEIKYPIRIVIPPQFTNDINSISFYVKTRLCVKCKHFDINKLNDSSEPFPCNERYRIEQDKNEFICFSFIPKYKFVKMNEPQMNNLDIRHY